jgi:hypothetical protein
LRQLSDGRHFIQLIYSEGGTTLHDCEYLRTRNVTRNFLRRFKGDEARARAAPDVERFDVAPQNVSFAALTMAATPPEAWLDYGALAAACRKSHRQVRSLLQHREHGADRERDLANNQLSR